MTPPGGWCRNSTNRRSQSSNTTTPAAWRNKASLRDAYLKAYECDPASAYGGVLAFNRPIDGDTADEVAKLFVECIVSPGYDAVAREKFAAKKNLRLLEMHPDSAAAPLMLKPILGGMLLQEADLHRLDPAKLTIATKRAPSDAEMRGLLFAWKVCKHVKSNTMVFAREGQTLGVGAGQMSRVDSTKIAAIKAAAAGLFAGRQRRSPPTPSSPFPDALEEAGPSRCDRSDSAGWLGARCDCAGSGGKDGHGDGLYRGAALPPL